MEINTTKIRSNPSISIDYAGQGEMIIFLHGFGGNKKNWTENLIFFSQKYLSVAWDTRGYGESEDYEGDLNFEDILDDLLTVFKHFNRNTRIFIVFTSIWRLILKIHPFFFLRVKKTQTFCM